MLINSYRGVFFFVGRMLGMLDEGMVYELLVGGINDMLYWMVIFWIVSGI